MVEGPGATRNGRKVQAVVGMVLKEASLSTNKWELSGRRVESAYSVGKEVFLVLGKLCDETRQDETLEGTNERPVALRLHFGMNGVLTVRKQNENSKLAPWRRRDAASPKCTLTFGNDETTLLVVEMVSSTCVPVSAFVATSKLSRLTTRDVCGSDFDPNAVLEALQTKDSMICDALLDQERFPGVGNIIKIEGLHEAGLHPRRLMNSFSRQELLQAIDSCRAYAMAWLTSGKAPLKKVYNQTICGTCKKGRVRMVKMGNDLRRVTFWCESCQPLVPSSMEKVARSIHEAKKSVPQPSRPIPSCPQHGTKRVILRRVRATTSANKQRLFRACGIKGCQYFCWADAHFPACRCGLKAVLKASKTERTGGKWFLSCAKGKASSSTNAGNKQQSGCSFFQWATPLQLAPLKDLSPLT